MTTAEKDDEPSLGLFQRKMRMIREGIRAIVWQTLLWRFALATRNVVTLEDALDFAFSSRFNALITPVQIRSEIRALCEIVLQRRPKTVLEIGTYHGGTVFLFSRVVAPDAFIVSVDLPIADLKPWRSLCMYLGMKGQNVYVIDGDSNDTSTVEGVHRALGDRKVDFLFIDGNHRYESVRQDFENYVGFLNDTGMVAFHDINPDHLTRFGKRTASYTGEVYRFWTEVKMKYPHAELIDNPDEDGFGIGIIFVGSNVSK